MNGDVEGEAPRPRPLSAGIWTLFSWLRRTDRSSSSESVSSVGSDRTVASFDFLAPLNYKHTNTPLVLPSGPLTDTYKQRLHERNLRRQHDRDLTLRRKYGLFREEGLGYDAFSLPSARRLQKDTVLRQDRERRATSESTRRSAYVPGKRRAPLPPVAISATLPRAYKRKRPAPKPPVKLSEENKENVEINKIIQMNSTAEIGKHSPLSKDINLANKTEKHNKHETKEIKLRPEKSFLKQIFDSKKRNSAIDTSRIKFLPSISELDKQAAEIIEANKALRASGRNDSSFTGNGSRSSSAEETWICTTCLRKYKPVVTCCIYCVIKENSNIKNNKNISMNTPNTQCTQTEENALKSNRKSVIEDKKKLREMLKEMKDSLPKRPKHNDKYPVENRDCVVKPTETPTLRIGSTIDENMKVNFKNTNTHEKGRGADNFKNSAKETFLLSQPSSSTNFPVKFITSNVAHTKSVFQSTSPNLNNSANSFKNLSTSQVLMQPGKLSPENSKQLLKTKQNDAFSASKNKQSKDVFSGDVKVTKDMNRSPNLENTNKSVSSPPKHDKTTNELLDDKGSDVQLNVNRVENEPFIDEISKHSPFNNSTDTKIDAILVENNKNMKVSKILVNNNQPTVLQIKKCDSSDSDKHERIQLGNVISPNNVNMAQTGRSSTSNNTRNADLHTPLKISSLLNPIYCPKNKTSNDKVSDCNFANILKTKPASMENNKKVETLLNQQPLLPNITVPTFKNAENQSTSNTKVMHEALQKSEATPTEASKVKQCENPSFVQDDRKRKIGENSSTEVKSTTTSSVKILDHHDRRRNLINQLEQAIAKGDEQLAAEAAAKLAKLKLACSVLSFSSHIVAQPMPNKSEVLQDNVEGEENQTKPHMNLHSASNVRVDSKELPDTAINDKDRSNRKPSTIICKEINILPEATASTSIQTLHDEIPIEVWVEDKEAARGPIPLLISRKARMRELKRHVETSLGLEIRLQRWIVGRTLCTDDNTPLIALAGPDLNAPFYLCLVESETNKDNSSQIKDDTHAQMKAEPNEINNTASGDVYTELMKLEQQALVPNTEEFECGVCIEQCAVGVGAVLRECIHTFCRECLVDVIRHCEEPVVACPAIQCPGALQEREIRAILSTEEYERWLARGLAAAESGTRNTFHCRTRDCKGWAFCEPGVRRFPCPVCKHTNCVPCQAVHEGETCEQYQEKLREAVSAAESNQTDEGTQALLKSLISRGEALECPECSAIITKKWGCDWVKCSACKTEICWVTKGRRWGPGGKGDTSGGCRCGVEGKRCHPSCGYCH